MSTTAMATIHLKKVANTNAAIFRTTVRRVRKGAILIGLLAGFLIAMQGEAMVKTYTSQASREAFAHTLTSSPALGILYGEPLKVDTPAGYMLYRSLPIAAIFVALWALFTITKLLRGEEENGRWEMMLSGQTTASGATISTLLGCAVGLAMTFVVTSAIVALVGSSPDIAFSFGRSVITGLAVIAPATVFIGIGALTSQLGGTRRRALWYGLTALISFILLRSVGNVVHDVSWLKYLTPFGWLDKMHLVADMQLQWFWPFVGAAIIFRIFALYWTSKRDLNQSIIAEPDITKPNYALLGSPWKFGLRQSLPMLSGWLLCTVFVSGLIASLAKLAIQATKDSDQVTKALQSFTGGDSVLSLAFIGMGTFMTAILLMVVVSASMGSIRQEEASGRADNFLIGPISRMQWFTGRLLLAMGGTAIISCISSLVVWVVANRQGVAVGFGDMFIGSISILGPITLLLGIGALVYGLKPRLAMWSMYAILIWSFTLDLLSSALSLNKWLDKTSLFHYVTLVPAAKPNWATFWVLLASGIALAAIGIICFNRRDLEAE